MDHRQGTGGNVPLRPSLTKLVMKPKSEKVRRPPNAFMLFAREHRRIIASRHPDVSNKVVSSMLGKIWKGTAQNVKEKYFKEAKMLDEQHKIKYPGYVYSPREARIQKMNRKRKKDQIILTKLNKEDLHVVMKNSRKEKIPKEETRTADTSQDVLVSPEYVPNNPEYFTQQSPESDNEESSNLQPCNQYSSKSESREEETDEMSMNVDHETPHRGTSWPIAAEGCGCCSRDRLESDGPCFAPYVNREDEASHHFPNPPHCSYPTPSHFCNTSAHFPGPMSSFCCGPAPCNRHRPWTSPFHRYWSSSPMNPHCYRNRDSVYDDMNSFPFQAPYHGPDFYRPPFGYFDRPIEHHGRNPSSGFYPYLNENWDRFRQLPNEFANPEYCPRMSRTNDKEENLSNLQACRSSYEEGVNLQSEKQFQTSEQNSKQSAFVNVFNVSHVSVPDPPEISNSNSTTCSVETLNKLEDQPGMSNQTQPLTEIPEGKINASQTTGYFSGNKNPYDSNRNKYEEHLVDSSIHMIPAPLSENQSSSSKLPCTSNISNSTNQYTENIQTVEDMIRNKCSPSKQPCTSNISNSPNQYTANVQTVKDMSSAAPSQKFYKPTISTTSESTKSHIKNITGINPLFTTTKFQEICKRPYQSMKNAVIRMPVNCIRRSSTNENRTTSEAVSSIECKDYTMNNSKDNPNMHLQSLCTDDKMNAQTLRKNFDEASVTNFENLHEVKANNYTVNSQPQFSHPFVKGEMNKPHFFSSDDVNMNLPATERVTVSNNEQIYYPKMITKLNTFNTASTDQSSGKDENQKYTRNNSDTYSKKLSENLNASQHFMDTTELDLNEYSLRCMEQKDLPKMYYEQKDGSYVAGENFKFNTLKGNVPCKLILNDSLATDETANRVCLQ